MRVALLDRPKQLNLVEAEVKNALNEVMKNGACIMGPQVTESEKKTARCCCYASYYKKNLNIKGLITTIVREGAEHHIYNQYVIKVKDRRDELRAILTKQEIFNEVYYPLPFHQQECFSYLGHKKCDFANSEYALKHSQALPIFSELSVAMQEHVVRSRKDFYQEN
jgi:dTDP-4-amino-4,6-dideoxygalactose transaminase